MRTAIVFLAIVAAIVLVGSIVPQQDTSSQAKVDAFLAEHRNLDALATHLGLPLTGVFVSPLFLGVLASLYVALGACVLRRLRALVVRTLRGYPRTPQFWGEWGSWTFHASFFLLLVAVLYGKSTGFEGIMTITEGQTLAETPSSFDTLRQGILFDGHHAGFGIRLDRFRATFQPNGQPADFVSRVTVVDHGRPVVTKDIRVNDFLAYDGVDVYQQDYGFAPEIVVRNPMGRVVFDSPIQLFGADKSRQQGALKVPDFGYTLPGASRPVQLGARLTLFPDARAVAKLGADGSVIGTTAGPGGEEARNPVLMLLLYVGDLGLSSGAAQSVNDLDTSHMVPYFADGRALPLGLGQSIQLPLSGTDCSDPVRGGCFTVTFARLPQYSLFHVKRDAGVPFVYVTFVLIMGGLLAKLYVRPLLEGRQRRRAASSGDAGLSTAWLDGSSSEESGEAAASAATSSGLR